MPRGPAAIIAGLIVVAPCAAARAEAPAPDPAQLVARMRGAYYSLAREGFAGAHCDIAPDWPYMVGKARSDPTSQATFATLEALRFTLTLDARGQAAIGKSDTGPTRTDGPAQGVQQVFDGMDEVVSGVFTTWRDFVISPPTPARNLEVQVTPRAGGYRMTYHQDGDVAAEVLPDGTVTRIETRAGELAGTLQPRFAREAGGLLLTGYVTDYAMAGGAASGHVEVAIDYQTVEGLRFPKTLTFKATSGGEAMQWRLALTGCRMDRK